MDLRSSDPLVKFTCCNAKVCSQGKQYHSSATAATFDELKLELSCSNPLGILFYMSPGILKYNLYSQRIELTERTYHLKSQGQELSEEEAMYVEVGDACVEVRSIVSAPL